MYQSIQIIGRLGRDPEMRYTPQGEPVVSFSVAVDKTRKGADGNTQKETMWVRVSAWGKLAENCNQYLTKGKLVFVAGTLNFDGSTGGPRVYEVQGEKRASFELNAAEVKFLSPKGEAGPAFVDDAGVIPF